MVLMTPHLKKLTGILQFNTTQLSAFYFFLSCLTTTTVFFQHNIAVHNIVLVLDNNNPLNSWPLGRILEVYTSVNLKGCNDYCSCARG